MQVGGLQDRFLMKNLQMALNFWLQKESFKFKITSNIFRELKSGLQVDKV